MNDRASITATQEIVVDEVFAHMWAQPKKLDDPAVLKAALPKLPETPSDVAEALASTAAGAGLAGGGLPMAISAASITGPRRRATAAFSSVSAGFPSSGNARA